MSLSKAQKDKQVEHLRNIKKGLNALTRFIWKKETKLKFATIFQVKAFLEMRSQQEKLAALKH